MGKVVKNYNKSLNRIAKEMDTLGKYQEMSIFISQNLMMEENTATSLMICLPGHGKDKNEDYLALRRLLNAFVYRFNAEDQNFEIEITLKQRTTG